jgi:hypothetical protein
VITRLRRGFTRSSVLALSAAFLVLTSPSVGALGLAILVFSPYPQSSSHPSMKDYALIYGTVWSAGGHPVSGIPIKIRRAADKKPKWELISDRSGEFAQRVPAGAQDYIIQADVKTPNGQPKPEVTVHIDDNERKDVGIHLNQ